jgi:hypothetical protein
MSTLEQIKHVKNKYKEMDIIFENDLENMMADLSIDDEIWFNPNIDPEKVYIPLCTQCSNDYIKFKSNHIYDDMKIEFKHPNSCLWYDWFVKKIKQTCPSIKIVKKLNK